MTADEVVAFFDRYAVVVRRRRCAEHTSVQRVAALATGSSSRPTTANSEPCNVVIATGWCDRPAVPAIVRTHCRLASIRSSPSNYRNPDDLPAGGVLVVGASATGVQLAEELHASGRPVTLAIGRHSRMPRTLPRHGRVLVARPDRHRSTRRSTMSTIRSAARTEPSLQLVGRNRSPHPRPGGSPDDGRPPRRPADRPRRHPRHVRCRRRRHRRRRRAAPRRRARARRRSGRPARADPRGARARPARPPVDRFRAATRSTSQRPGSRRSSGRPATAVPTSGWTSRSSTNAARSPSTAASRRCRAPTCSASGSSTTATRTSSTASDATHGSSPSTSVSPLAPSRRDLRPPALPHQK